jgi:hypothetical protein
MVFFHFVFSKKIQILNIFVEKRGPEKFVYALLFQLLRRSFCEAKNVVQKKKFLVLYPSYSSHFLSLSPKLRRIPTAVNFINIKRARFSMNVNQQRFSSYMYIIKGEK